VSGVWLTDAAKVLRAAGLKVKEEKYTSGPFQGRSWKSVSAAGKGYPDLRFFMWHHDASPEGPTPGALEWMKASGPAANMWVALDGTWHVLLRRGVLARRHRWPWLGCAEGPDEPVCRRSRS